MEEAHLGAHHYARPSEGRVVSDFWKILPMTSEGMKNARRALLIVLINRTSDTEWALVSL